MPNPTDNVSSLPREVFNVIRPHLRHDNQHAPVELLRALNAAGYTIVAISPSVPMVVATPDPKPAPLPEGWGWPFNARLAHYFVDGRSLCGRWGYVGKVDPGSAIQSGHDCTVCIRKLVLRRDEQANAAVPATCRKKGKA